MWEAAFQTNARTAVSLKSSQSQGLVLPPTVLPQDQYQNEHRLFKRAMVLSREGLGVTPSAWGIQIDSNWP